MNFSEDTEVLLTGTYYLTYRQTDRHTVVLAMVKQVQELATLFNDFYS